MLLLRPKSFIFTTFLTLSLTGLVAFAQSPFGFGPGPGRPGPPNRSELKLLDDFDEDQDGWLNQQERDQARQAAEDRRKEQGGRRFGPPGGRRGPGRNRRGSQEPPKAGRKVDAAKVPTYKSGDLFDNSVLRTLFLEFDSDDWETELEAFKDTDVEVPAQLTVDGVTYPQVGVHFRGMSSYHMVSRGFKRSLNVSLDFVNEDQRLYGYKTLNLLNCNGDASMMSTVLYSHIAQDYLAVPKANFVEVVINGESWGVYANVQQFNKIFLKENFDPSKGTRWKVPGSPAGDGGLRYLGDSLEEYKSRFEMKSNDGEEPWQELVELCRVLNETPLEQMPSAIESILDIDNVLKFLALDVALVNSDGYWTRSSDYNIFLDEEGMFHLIPHDMNEAFHGSRPGPRRGRNRNRQNGPPSGGPQQGEPPRGEFGPPEGFEQPPEGFRPPPGFGPPEGGPGAGGPGAGGPRRGGPGGGGPGRPGHGSVDLDPLVGLENDRTPLRSRLLAIPEYREKYLGYIHEIAENSLDWKKIAPFIKSQRKLISRAVKLDTRKLASYQEFESAQGELRDFFLKRREFLLHYDPDEKQQQSNSANKRLSARLNRGF